MRIPGRIFGSFFLSVLILLSLFSFRQAAYAKDATGLLLFSTKGSAKDKDKSAKELPEIPQDLDHAKINEIIAGLSDDQVRRLLLRELEKTAAAVSKKEEKKPEQNGLGRIVQSMEENVTLFHKRLTEIHSGAVAVPDFLPRAYADIRGQGGTENILRMFIGVIILLTGGLGAEWLFRRYVAEVRRRITDSAAAHWMVKMKRLLLRASVEFVSLCVFASATLLLFFLFFNFGPFSRLVLITYLAVVIVARIISLVSRLLLAPDVPALRIVPLEDGSALYCHRWIMRIVTVLGAGFLVRGLLELQGISEETVIFIRAVVAAVTLCIIVYLVFDNRDSVAQNIRRGGGDPAAGTNLLRMQLANFWHLMVLPYLVIAWGLWVFYLLVGRADLVVPLLGLFSSVPIFLILDGLGQRLLTGLFGFLENQDPVVPAAEAPKQNDDEEKKPDTDAPTEPGPGVTSVGRVVPILRRCMTFSIMGVILFSLLELWGLNVHIGEQVTGASLKILLILSLSYVAWRLIEGAINRKLIEVQGSIMVDEDSEMGGTGGSRLGTLLQIFRKFLLIVLLAIVSLIVLSSIGIDTKPLLAGAGILGLAIGLGTQNLIKDIVSGIFFLIDDAFRIGDYVESGKAKGTVEAISLRSLKLRHSRGMVHNVPFSQLGMVTNFSRDYNIIKLDFRVPFGTDIDKVRKVVKKINKEIQEDTEMGPDLLGPVKFAGVLGFDDSALIMRVKFKSKPGLQFLIQRHVNRRLQELFSERGLEFATRHVMVRIPEDSVVTSEDAAGTIPAASSGKGGLSAAAAAGISRVIAEEEAKKKLLEEETKA